MDESQDRDDAHAQPKGARDPLPGGRSGEGAASAMQQVIADSRRQQREQPGAEDSDGSHPQ
jgi:hypothetical protein